MSQVKLLKINASGLPEEMDTANDDITLNSYTAATSFDVTSGVSIGQNITFNAVTDTIAGIQNQNLLDKTAAETISANYTIATGFDLILTDQPVNDTDAANKLYVDTQLATIEGGNITDYTNGNASAITQGECVYISAADTVDLADASADATAKPIGFVNDASIAAAGTGGIITEGVATGLTGLTAGSRYYLDSNAGAVTATPPTGVGNNVIQVGFAKNATDLQIKIQFIGKRA